MSLEANSVCKFTNYVKFTHISYWWKCGKCWYFRTFVSFCSRGQEGGGVKWLRLSTLGGEGVKIGQNLVHVVFEWPQTKTVSMGYPKRHNRISHHGNWDYDY